MIKSYKYQLNPTNKQINYFERNFGCCRFIYNWGLGLKIKTYKETGKSIGYVELARELTLLKQNTDYKWLNDISNESLQQSLRNLETAFMKFFREKKGFPKFKNRYISDKSFKNIQNIHVDFQKHKIKIPIIGWIKFYKNQEFNGKTGTITVSKDSTNRYWVSILVEDGIELPTKIKIEDNDKTIGIDLGLKYFMILSNGIKIENPKFLEKVEKKLACYQRRLSYYVSDEVKKKRQEKCKETKEKNGTEIPKEKKHKFKFQKHVSKHKKYQKIKGSNRWEKQKLRTADIYRRVHNLRVNYIHQVTNKLVKEYDTLIFEDLNVSGMVKNHKLANSISSVSWYETLRQISYKCNWYGKNFIQVDRFDPTSKLCSKCGYKKDSLELSEREWICPVCGTCHDRDVNAARNIRNFGLIGQVKQHYNKIKHTPVVNGGEDVELPELVGAKKRQDNISLIN
ncbi:hypothetical protein EZS27_007732 [termite gut metagenome]|uniref:Transposase n=1 Tax=termite gut metagenome TaxID=433724 RepID=A0A5J4SFT8_9ZZZZ